MLSSFIACIAGENCLALPKLNLQFLTFHDYLLRNFNLFRLEATYEIREDISDVIGRVAAFRQVSVLQTSQLPALASCNFAFFSCAVPFTLACTGTLLVLPSNLPAAFCSCPLPFAALPCSAVQFCYPCSDALDPSLYYCCWPLAVRPSPFWLDHTCLCMLEAIRP